MSHLAPIFSLIVSTYGRSEELNRLFQSLSQQTLTNFEVILIDQNDDNRVTKILTKYTHQMTVKYFKGKNRGLSNGRNQALKHISGEIIAFPDDDCHYGNALLEQVHNYFRLYPNVGGITGEACDLQGKPWKSQVANEQLGVKPSFFLHNGISWTNFVRAETAKTAGLFDIRLGVGAGTRWGACEESDWMMRAMTSGMRFDYQPQNQVFHDYQVDKIWSNTHKILSYARGHGALIQKHFGLTILIKECLFCTLAGTKSMLNRNWARSLLHFQRALAIVDGYLSFFGSDQKYH